MAPNLHVAAALLALEELRSDLAAEIATVALGHGVDCEELGTIAGGGCPDPSEWQPMFRRALARVPIAVPPVGEACLVVALWICDRFLRCELCPADAAWQVARLAGWRQESPAELQVFVAVDAEFQEALAGSEWMQVEDCERRLRAAASGLCEQHALLLVRAHARP